MFLTIDPNAIVRPVHNKAIRCGVRAAGVVVSLLLRVVPAFFGWLLDRGRRQERRDAVALGSAEQKTVDQAAMIEAQDKLARASVASRDPKRTKESFHDGTF